MQPVPVADHRPLKRPRQRREVIALQVEHLLGVTSGAPQELKVVTVLITSDAFCDILITEVVYVVYRRKHHEIRLVKGAYCLDHYICPGVGQLLRNRLFRRALASVRQLPEPCHLVGRHGYL